MEMVMMEDVTRAETSGTCRVVIKNKTGKVIWNSFGEGHQYQAKEFRLYLIVKGEPGTIQDI